MNQTTEILIAKGARPHVLLPRFANRHGLIAGATGTGKTVTLQTIAEGLSARGIPVFLADVKGDIAGLSRPGVARPKIAERIEALGIADHRFEGFPTLFWDLFGEQGHPIRATISDVGPLLFARLVAEQLVDELFLTSSPALFGHFPNDQRKSLVDGLDLGGVQLELWSARRHDSHLFLRYGVTRPPTSRRSLVPLGGSL